ncbi:hypothetical protein AALP_AA8G453800 [Arabis alpina]|uniref:F-box domain-containing protein n=1 Tax=Arabis alpina TaxID=50452 RepID=A0A087GDK9_ARAAL|nr:hypothetical protein AALP_AA8G453800 [Arabis alpina]
MSMPLDLKIEILTRLPSKSLMRFKCVSKLWFSIIRCRYLTNRHFTLASPPRSPRLYVSLVDHQHDCDSMEVCHNPGKSLLVSLSRNNADSFDKDLSMPARQSLTLPAVKSNIFDQEVRHKYVDYFLGHDHVLDQYKVVCTVSIASNEFTRITTEHWVFVLEVGGSWKRIEFNQPHLPTDPGASVCINGVIHYLAGTGSVHHDIVVSFDVRSEEFSMIQTPRDVTEITKSMGFIEYGGKPAILDHSDLVDNGSVELWVLQDGGKWSRKSPVLQPCHMHLVNNISGVLVQGTTRNGEVILEPLSEPFHCCILYYDLQKNDLRKVEIRGIPDQEFTDPSIDLKLMDKSESIMHLEI